MVEYPWFHYLRYLEFIFRIKANFFSGNGGNLHSLYKIYEIKTGSSF